MIQEDTTKCSLIYMLVVVVGWRQGRFTGRWQRVRRRQQSGSLRCLEQTASLLSFLKATIDQLDFTYYSINKQ
jgi:hypothetical protein